MTVSLIVILAQMIVTDNRQTRIDSMSSVYALDIAVYRPYTDGKTVKDYGYSVPSHGAFILRLGTCVLC